MSRAELSLMLAAEQIIGSTIDAVEVIDESLDDPAARFHGCYSLKLTAGELTLYASSPTFYGPTEPTRYIAEFVPQAWVNGSPVKVDHEGPTEWDATSFIVSALSDEWQEWAQETIARGSDHEDVLRQDPAAPEWVREWVGPFETYLEVRP